MFYGTIWIEIDVNPKCGKIVSQNTTNIVLNPKSMEKKGKSSCFNIFEFVLNNNAVSVFPAMQPKGLT